MRTLLTTLALAATTLAFAGNGDKVTVTVNGKEEKKLAEGLFLKPGGYKAGPKVGYKRADLKAITVTAPTEGMDGPTDSLAIKVTGFAGSVGFYKEIQNVAPGGTASFDISEAATKDYTPTGKQQSMVGRFEVEVTPLKRANAKGMYKGSISVE